MKNIQEVLDEKVKELSKLQLELMQQKNLDSIDFNIISDLINDLKEYMINCKSYLKKAK